MHAMLIQLASRIRKMRKEVEMVLIDGWIDGRVCLTRYLSVIGLRILSKKVREIVGELKETTYK